MSVQICRLCLSQTSVYFSLLDCEAAAMLESLTSIKVTYFDEMSTMMCTQCRYNLKLAYDIQQNMIISDKKLRNQDVTFPFKDEAPFLPLDVIIKQEDEPEILQSDEILNEDEDILSLAQLSVKQCIICGSKMDGLLILNHIKQHYEEEQTCHICHGCYPNAIHFKNHMINEHTNRSLNFHHCQSCKVMFRFQYFYDTHNRIYHKPDTSQVIKAKKPIFEPPFPQESRGGVVVDEILAALEKKLEQKRSKSPETFVCEICYKTFTSRGKYSSHKGFHKKSKCPICGIEVTHYYLKKHIENHKGGSHICEFCGASLKTKDSLRMHVFNTHRGVSFKCEDCDKSFKKKVALDKHHRKEHTGEPVDVCDICGRKFYVSGSLTTHKNMVHLKLRFFHCETCDKGFTRMKDLNIHRRQHTNEKPYKCGICGEGFKQNVSLRGHKKSKHNIIEQETVSCKVCGKGFASEAAIHSHMRVHL